MFVEELQSGLIVPKKTVEEQRKKEPLSIKFTDPETCKNIKKSLHEIWDQITYYGRPGIFDRNEETRMIQEIRCEILENFAKSIVGEVTFETLC